MSKKTGSRLGHRRALPHLVPARLPPWRRSRPASSRRSRGSCGAVSSPRRRSRTAPPRRAGARYPRSSRSVREHESRLDEPRAAGREQALAVAGSQTERASPRPNRSAKEPRACRPTCGTTSRSVGFHLHVCCAGTVHLGSALLEGDAAARHSQFPLSEGPFRGYGLIRSQGRVNYRG